jgi:hypothetical protein
MAFDPKDTRNLVIALGLGAAAGAAIIQSHHDEHAKSQAGKDDPEGTEWICNIVWDCSMTGNRPTWSARTTTPNISSETGRTSRPRAKICWSA